MDFSIDDLDVDLPVVPDLEHLPAWLQALEQVDAVRAGLETKIDFFEGEVKKREYVLLYLHGFGSSSNETRPLVDIIAKKLGAHIVFARLARHGIDSGAMDFFSARSWYYSALRGLAIANKVGRKVIIMSCSTGGALSLLLSARSSSSKEIAYQVLMSPNCWPQPVLTCALFLSPLRTFLERIPTIPVLGYIMSPARPRSKEKIKTSHLVYTAISDLHAHSNTLMIPTSAIYHMMCLVRVLWVLRRRMRHRYKIPAFIIASVRDKKVSFGMTKFFFSAYPVEHPMELLTDSSHHKKHVLAGDIFSESSTQEVADIIYANLPIDIKSFAE